VRDTPKAKRKLTASQKRSRKERSQKFMTIVIHGKQKRFRRLFKIDGVDVDKFTRQNADPIWLHQNEMWEYMDGSDEG
jgi:16S rRNA U516 pseudouridylate synthase RsuA-like enzyme